MWIEVRNKEIVGIHSEEIVCTNGNDVISVDADVTCLGKWYTKTKGIHDPVITTTQQIALEKEKLIEDSKIFLTQTDYVVMKISEASVLGTSEDVHDLITKYADILEKRKEARALIV